MIILILFAFLSGIITILSPCILPMLPVILTGSIGNRRRPYGIITGFIISFVVFTLSLTFLVDFLNVPTNTLRTVAYISLILFGLIMLTPKLKETFEILVSLINRGGDHKKRDGFSGGFFIGLTLGIIWTPCVGPIMASVITLAATQNVNLDSVFIILSYSIGTALPMLAVIYGGKAIITKVPFLTRNPEKLERFFGIIMIIVGISIAFNLDRQFQNRILNLFPNYGSGLTAFENSDIVQNALGNNLEDSGDFRTSKEPEKGKLGYYGLAPEPLLGLKGSVVIVDFWTYSCVNCVRTIPYLRSWYENYKGLGLEIVGVHTPEFVFERDKNNVDKAVKDLGITWPVIQDNDYSIWNSYNNRYWPAKYFIDINGVVRYFHFGEGDYETSEKVIRALLIEAGVEIDNKPTNMLEEENQSNTPEIYLGYSRSRGFKSVEKILADKSRFYSLVSNLENGMWSLSGNWLITEEYIIPQDSGDLVLNFFSKDLYIVIEPEGTSGFIEVYLNNEKVQEIRPTQSRLYKLLELDNSGSNTLRLRVDGP
ncbi:redoxin domain-containing protein [Thiospirochaeta perfilievii]|uniref:Redoxin domain-containing protein n=1 Tax=Thiospirochaeta perfilievii TaxID=252967 RepID=A0A5C1Q8V6_9SPIO|nr:cytochrome c biogenesis protein CcdA [Thiospirochaeta perfilievii]QEN03867.1 redoxin domain-containing protein [Thiospirochaeta perfilievii]